MINVMQIIFKIKIFIITHKKISRIFSTKPHVNDLNAIKKYFKLFTFNNPLSYLEKVTTR